MTRKTSAGSKVGGRPPDEGSLYASLASSLDALVAVFDRSFRHLRCDGGLLSGSPTAEALLGRTPREAFTPEAYTRIEPVYRVALGGQRARAHVDLAGARLTCEAIPLRDGAGDPAGGIAVYRDAAPAGGGGELPAAVLERVTDGIVALDRDWRYAFINEPGAAMFGKKPGDLLGKRIWEEFPEGISQPFHLAYERAFAEQKVIVFEDHYAPWDRWFENRVYPSPNGLTIYYSDITERKRTENALALSEERLRLAVAAGGIGLWDWDLDTNRVWFSPEWKRQIGYRDNEIADRFEEWESRVHPEDLPGTLRLVRAFVANPWPDYSTDFRFRHKDGSWRWIRALGAIIGPEAGKSRRMVGAHVDVTEFKRTEETLLARKRVFRMLASGVPLLDTLDELLRSIEAQAPGMITSILLLDDDGTTFRAGAGPSIQPEYLRALQGRRIGPAAGSCGTAAFRREPVYVGDIASDPLWAPYRHLVEPYGYRSCWSTPIFNPEGAVIGTFAIYDTRTGLPDRTQLDLIHGATSAAAVCIEHDRRERKLVRTAASLEAAQEHAKLGSWELEPSSGRGVWSAQMCRLFGRDPSAGPPTFEEFKGYLHPDDLPALMATHSRLAASAGEATLEFRTHPSAGPVRRFFATIHSSPAGPGGSLLMSGTLLDITDLREAQEAVRRNEEFLRLVIEATNDGIWDWNIVTGAVSWSARARQMLGVGGGSIPRTLDEALLLVHPDDREPVRAALRAQATDDVPFSMRVRLQRGEGGIGHFLVRGKAVRDAAGSRVRMVGSIGDVTESVLAEERLKDSRRELEALSNHLLGVIEEERSRIAREMHDDLGQILAAIRMHLTSDGGMTVPGGTGGQARIPELVDEANRTIRRIIRDLRPEILDTLGLRAGLEWQASEFTRRYGIPCTFRAAGDDPAFGSVTSTALFRAMQEALTNVARHARASSVRAVLECGPEGATLTVADDGAGISPEDLRKPDSFGLMGLRERIRALGGDVSLSPNDGAGALLVVRVPIPGISS